MDGDQLRDRLLHAVNEQDEPTFVSLCTSHQDAILRHFGDWARPPEAVRGDRAALDRYARGLITVASYFDQRLGRPELLRILTGGESNALGKWEESLAAAQERMNAQAFEEAAKILEDSLIDGRDLKGPGADQYLPVTYGWLGTCYFQSGRAEKATGPFETALRLCESNRDEEGIRAYVGNLFEIHRWLRRGDDASRWAERLSTLTPNPAWWKRQAAIVRAGEPLVRVVVAIGGEEFEIDDAPKADQIEFRFRRNRITLARSAALTDEGERHGSEGRYEDAVDCFQRASAADPFDPHPRYLAGFTLLHLQRYPEAVERFSEAEELGPGWFHCRTDLWLAQELALGRLHEAAFPLLVALEDSPSAPEEKLRLAEAAPAELRDLAPVRLSVGRCFESLDRRDDAVAEYRKGLERAAEPDVRTRLLVCLGVATRDRDALRKAMELGGNLVAGAQARYALKHGF